MSLTSLFSYQNNPSPIYPGPSSTFSAFILFQYLFHPRVRPTSLLLYSLPVLSGWKPHLPVLLFETVQPSRPVLHTRSTLDFLNPRCACDFTCSKYTTPKIILSRSSLGPFRVAIYKSILFILSYVKLWTAIGLSCSKHLENLGSK